MFRVPPPMAANGRRLRYAGGQTFADVLNEYMKEGGSRIHETKPGAKEDNNARHRTRGGLFQQAGNICKPMATEAGIKGAICTRANHHQIGKEGGKV